MSELQELAETTQDPQQDKNNTVHNNIGTSVAEGESTATIISNLQETGANDSNPVFKINKIYVSNVPYDATEDDLFQLFAPFGCYNVLIPAQTVRGFRRRAYSRSFGIAYADFETPEQAKVCVEKLNNIVFQHRNLVLKLYEPFIPQCRKQNYSGNAGKHGMGNKGHVQPINVSDLTNDEEGENGLQKTTKPGKLGKKHRSTEKERKNNGAVKKDPSSNQGESNESNSGETAQNKRTENSLASKKEVSETTVYITNLDRKVTEVELKILFQEYGPVDIYTFYKKYHSRGLHIRIWQYAALVEFGESFKDPYITDNDYQIDRVHDNSNDATGSLECSTIPRTTNKAIEASKKFNNQKLKGKNICVRPAYMSKIREIQNANVQDKTKVSNENEVARGPESEHVAGESSNGS